ncbi:metal-sensitive transcriptional regulator [Salidesulfovibrio onnuriiensis]|uniref:metal-sensitive transcriptional regulator n=1 Tax=Salidesulfovibrio onnuriiensis TaxID=2583823 RepID=UPI00202B9368|nr:metal-sensitive transcriptional regulator [Salidesulfovibrio onnuriiensis]
MTQTDSEQLKQEQMKKNLLSRLKRVEGQVRGIQRMIEEGKECRDILTQVRAVRSAMQSASTQILKHYLLECHAETASGKEQDRDKLEDVIKLLTDYMDG